MGVANAANGRRLRENLGQSGELLGLIEYQGEQHYVEKTNGFGDTQRLITDPLKREYCKKRIFHYMKFDLMKKIHRLFLKLLPTYSLMQIPCQRRKNPRKGVTIIPQGSRFAVKLRVPKRCAPRNRAMI